MKKIVITLLCISMLFSTTVYATNTDTNEVQPVSEFSDAVDLSKSTTYNPETGLYDIVLETYSTGVIEEGQVLPADTVLVLDTSGSMAYPYKSTRIGTPMYGEYFHHSSLNKNYWGWYENNHLVNGKNPYVQLPDGSFAEARYLTTDANNVEVFEVVGGAYNGTDFYPRILTESVTGVPRAYNYPVYQLYSSTSLEEYNIITGVPIFGSRFEADNIIYYGWLGNSHGEPYVRLEDGSFVRAYYSETDSKKVEIFEYRDTDTGEVFKFYPRLDEKYNNVTRAKDLPIVQLYSSYNNTRMAALHDAVAEFLRLTAQNNTGLSGTEQSRVSIVRFSCDTHGGTAPTEILRNLTAITIDNVDEWIKFTYGIVDGGAHTHTEIGEGMLLAEDIVERASRKSHKAVIAFTDGKPECDVTSGGGFSYTETNKAIATASRLTQNYNADIYTVCIQDYAKVNSGASLPPDEGKGVNDDKNNINRFMHLLSSNYPNATNMTSTGDGSTSAGYYMVPGGEDDLVSIFTHIGEQIGSATLDLGPSSYVLDYVSPYFKIPAGAEVDLSVKDAYYSSGTLKWKDSTMNLDDISYTVNEADQSIKVTGFDYNHNFVATQGRVEGNIAENGDFYGRKLIIKFSVITKPDFLGGNHVETNNSNSGIYASTGNLIGTFPIPYVDVPIKAITPKAITSNIYVGEQANLPHIANVGQFVYDGNKNASIDGINNKFVNIEYVISDKPFINDTTTGNTLTYTIPAGSIFSGDYADIKWSGNLEQYHLLKEDTTFYVMIRTVPATTGNSTADFSTVSKTINVYKPHITFQDSSMNLGQTANYEDKNNNTVTKNYVDVVWKHGADTADVSLMGPAPTLTYTYSPVQGAFTQDTPVKITKVVPSETKNQSNFEHSVPANQDIIKDVTFYRNDCEFDGCEWGTSHNASAVVEHWDAENDKVKNEYTNFVVHLNSFDLKIKKDGWKRSDENQAFIFKVTGPNGYFAEVTIIGNNSVTIEKLPVGNYTITEITDWSWRYEPVTGTITINSSNVNNEGVVEVEFKNNRDKSSWLSGDSVVRNWFGKFINSNN